MNFETITFCFSGDKRILLTKEIQQKDVQIIRNIGGQQHIVIQEQSFINICLTLKEREKILEKYSFDSEAENKLFENLSKIYQQYEEYLKPI